MPAAPSKRPVPNAVVKRPGERRSLSRSATRALDVMEVFGTRRCALRAVEIASALSLTASSTNQLLKTMVGSGHLVFDARAKTYLPSARMTKFGGWIVELYNPQAHIRDLLTDIRRRTGLVTTASSPNDLFMQIIDSAIPDGATAERGLRISIVGSAVGAAYLSSLGNVDIARIAYRARLDEAASQRLLEEAVAVQQQGYAEGGSADDCIWSVAMALPQALCQVPTVVGIAGPVDQVRGRVPSLVETMRRAIAECFNGSTEVGEEG